jgi:hypothetical protein
MGALDHPIAEDASAGRVEVRPGADGFPESCQVWARDFRQWAWVDAREEALVGHQERLQPASCREQRLPDAHQQMDPRSVAQSVAVAKVVGQEPECPASAWHPPVVVSKVEAARRAAGSEAHRTAGQAPPPPEPR